LLGHLERIIAQSATSQSSSSSDATSFVSVKEDSEEAEGEDYRISMQSP
jgi:hypothetical protein